MPCLGGRFVGRVCERGSRRRRLACVCCNTAATAPRVCAGQAGRVRDALQRGDHFIFSNERQKYYHLPLLALAGGDCTRDAGGVVPISCPPALPAFQKPDDPVFVAGGGFWPWADMSAGLAELLRGAQSDSLSCIEEPSRTR